MDKKYIFIEWKWRFVIKICDLAVIFLWDAEISLLRTIDKDNGGSFHIGAENEKNNKLQEAGSTCAPLLWDICCIKTTDGHRLTN